MKRNSLRQLLCHWLEYMTTINRSQGTLESYRLHLSQFITWCDQHGISHAPQITLMTLESFQRWLRGYRRVGGSVLSINGQRERLGTVRQFMRWLLKRQHILYNPAEMLELPKEEKRLPRQVFSEEETEHVLAALDIRQPLKLRDRAILETLWSTGIRRMEVASLLSGDVDFGRGVVMVRQGKGNKDRVVPIGQRALSWIQRYLDSVRPLLSRHHDSGHLFLSQRGRGLARSTLTILANNAREASRVDKPGACHIWRHSMATQMLEHGADIRLIQEMLGHEKLETTQIYTRVSAAHLKAEHERTHPGSKQKEPNPKQQNCETARKS